jgi:aminoglycoside 2'-N-acetyltransferase I
MVTVRVAHTADLDSSSLSAARALLDGAFEDEVTEHDWEHALGGIHALAWDGEELMGHASVIQRRLIHAGRALRTGYVEGVAVRADRRRRGHGSAMMEALERVIRRGYELGALGATTRRRRCTRVAGGRSGGGDCQRSRRPGSSPRARTRARSTFSRSRIRSTSMAS